MLIYPIGAGLGEEWIQHSRVGALYYQGWILRNQMLMLSVLFYDASEDSKEQPLVCYKFVCFLFYIYFLGVASPIQMFLVNGFIRVNLFNSFFSTSSVTLFCTEEASLIYLRDLITEFLSNFVYHNIFCFL